MADYTEDDRHQLHAADDEAKRRRDQTAKLIGQYLLRGYRMLAAHCAECTVRHARAQTLKHVKVCTCVCVCVCVCKSADQSILTYAGPHWCDTYMPWWVDSIATRS